MMRRVPAVARSLALLFLLLLQCVLPWAALAAEPRLSEERVVFQLAQGDIEFAFMPEVRLIAGPWELMGAWMCMPWS